ncbi:MAG TPA: hypothetical protein VEQ10_02465 [Vicinamibacteria bacterium]|nr:hypothetical protein [Vicinamibacteria bacterium]
MRASALLSAAALVTVTSAAPLLAQSHPLQTEAATTARDGTLVFETGFDAMAQQPSYVTAAQRTGWSGPLLRLVYSPADSVELGLEWVARVGVFGDPARNGAASSDFGDVTVRAKWRVHEGEGARPTIAARFGVTLPETSFEDKQFRPLGLGPNTIRTFVEGLLTQPLGRGRLHLDLGLYLADQVYAPHDQDDFLSYAMALEWPLSATTAAVTEVAGRAGRGNPGTGASGEWRAGLRTGRGRLRFDLAVRRGLAWADGTWGGTVGLRWTAHQR